MLVLTRDSLISCLVAETVAPIPLTIRDVLSVVLSEEDGIKGAHAVSLLPSADLVVPKNLLASNV